MREYRYLSYTYRQRRKKKNLFFYENVKDKISLAKSLYGTGVGNMDVAHSASPNYRLRQERIRHNWRQQELADLLGIAPVTVSRWEGGTQQPSLYYREKLCAFFGKSPEELGLVPEKPILLEGASVWNVPFPR